MHPLRLLSRAQIHCGDPPFAIWDLIGPTEIGGKQESSDFNPDHLLKRQTMNYFGHKKGEFIAHHCPPFNNTGIIWQDKHIGDREIVFSPGSHPTVSKKKKRPVSMRVLLYMWEFKEQWPCCESIPSVGLIKWTCSDSNYWCMTCRSKGLPRGMAVPPAYSRKNHISPHKAPPSIKLWFDEDLS